MIDNKSKISRKIVLNNGKDALEEDCVCLGGEWFLKTDPLITEDYFEKDRYYFKKNCFSFLHCLDDSGRLRSSQKLYTRNEKMFNKLPYASIGNDPYRFLDHKILLDNGYIECLETGIFYHKDVKNYAKTTKTGNYRKVNAIKKISPIENLLDNKKCIDLSYKYGISSPTFSITEGKRYSFGVELETCMGYIPNYLDEELNYSAVHDGSLRDANGKTPGGEYVTGVLTGDMGFKQLKLLCNILSSRCQINNKCGVHVHLGNIEFDKAFIVFMYYLGLKLETEIAFLLPKSRRNNEYCRFLKLIDIDLTQKFDSPLDYENYIESKHDEILKYVAYKDSLDPTAVNKQSDHPMGPKCNYDHNTARYTWLNFVPAMFNTRGNNVYTIEFRNMNASLNYLKIRNWILLCMSLVYVVENHKTFIMSNKSISLIDIIKLSYPKKAIELIKFIEERRIKFSTNSSKGESEEYIEENNDKSLTLKSL